MTILPKKKPASQQKAEAENPADAASQGPQEARERFNFAPPRTSPPAWPRHEEKRPQPDPGPGGGGGQAKRRHQTSPHRSVRKARTHFLGYPAPAVGAPPGAEPGAGGGAQKSPAPEGGPGLSCEGVRGDGEEAGADPSGYNSGDEYDRGGGADASDEELAERERQFEEKLCQKGYSIKKMGEDGACMFRAVADQVYGDQEMHAAVRKLCMDYMAKNSDYYSQYVTEDFDKYVQRKRSDHIHGNHIEMQAMSEMFNRHIEVYHYSSEPINIFHASQKTENEPIRLSYHRNVHYNSIVDPYKATIGVGLGLPAFKPDAMNKSLVSDAIRASENLQLEQAMLEDKLRATDWEATNEAIEEQIARESYLEWLRDNERKHRSKASPSATATSCSSLSGGGVDGSGGSPQQQSGRLSRSRCASASPCCDAEKESPRPGTSAHSGEGAAAAASQSGGFALDETASFLNQLPPSVFGLSDWEDSGILAKVLAESQQEYIDSLKHKKQ